MSVATMLEGKSKNLITASDSGTLEEIANLLAKNKIGAVVVCDGNQGVMGIVSERDIVREVSSGGMGALETKISKCMTKKVVSCKREDSVDKVMGLMTEHRFRHMPVTEDGQLIGIISIGDVVKMKILQAERDAEDLRNYIASG